MIWTKDKPSKPGWYWWRRQPHGPFMRQVYCLEGSWLCDGFSVDEMTANNGDWAGPLEPPIDYQAQAVSDELPYAK